MCSVFTPKFSRPLLRAALALTSIWIAGVSAAAAPPAWLSEARLVAIETAAGQTGEPVEALEVVGESVWRSSAGVQIASFKVDSLETSQGVEVGVAADLSVVDLEATYLAEAEAALDPALVFDPVLAARMAGAGPDELIEILVWLHAPPYEPLAWPEEFPADEAELDALDQVNAAALGDHLEPVFAVAGQRLADLGLSFGQSQNAPLLWTEARVDQIDQIASWPETARIAFDEEVELFLDVARPAIFRDRVPNLHPGRAFPTKAAVVEEGEPFLGHPALATQSIAVHGLPNSPRCPTVDPHITAVIGVILSTDARNEGIHRTARVMAGASCSPRFAFSRMVAATDQVIHKGAWVINYSWGFNLRGSLQVFDFYVDAVTRHRSRTFVVSAGNGRGGSHHVASPATAYNVLAVGASDDLDTVDRMDNTIAGFSSFIDPFSRHGDRVKPDLVAPGVGIAVPVFPTGFLSADGTSFSAPMVTAIVALALEREPWLHFFPSSLRAVLLATATGNPDGGEVRSDKDGTGELDAAAAVALARGQSGGWGTRRITCAGAPKLERVASFSLRALVPFRAASAWTVDPGFSGYASGPGADLDLILFDPSGRHVASSASFDSNTEAIFHIPAVSGTFSLAIRTLSCLSEPGNVGFAWWHEGGD